MAEKSGDEIPQPAKRAWLEPSITDLPPLTELTLQSGAAGGGGIGGTGGTGGGGSLIF